MRLAFFLPSNHSETDMLKMSCESHLPVVLMMLNDVAKTARKQGVLKAVKIWYILAFHFSCILFCSYFVECFAIFFFKVWNKNDFGTQKRKTKAKSSRKFYAFTSKCDIRILCIYLVENGYAEMVYTIVVQIIFSQTCFPW